jgi:hypothetical protein
MSTLWDYLAHRAQEERPMVDRSLMSAAELGEAAYKLDLPT